MYTSLRRLRRVVHLCGRARQVRLSANLVFRCSTVVTIYRRGCVVILLFCVGVVNVSSFVLGRSYPRYPRFYFPIFPIFFNSQLSFRLYGAVFRLQGSFFYVGYLRNFRVYAFCRRYLFPNVYFPRQLRHVLCYRISRGGYYVLPHLYVLFLWGSGRRVFVPACGFCDLHFLLFHYFFRTNARDARVAPCVFLFLWFHG